MNKKQIVDIVMSVFLIICGSLLLIFPLFDFVNIKLIFICIFGCFALINLVKFFFVNKLKEYDSLLTSLASILVIIIACGLDIRNIPWHLAVAIFIWIICISLIKLKSINNISDKKNNIWIFKLVLLILFILSGLLTTINLYYTNDIQVLILGFFYLIVGILDLLDPLMMYLIKLKK